MDKNKRIVGILENRAGSIRENGVPDVCCEVVGVQKAAKDIRDNDEQVRRQRVPLAEPSFAVNPFARVTIE